MFQTPTDEEYADQIKALAEKAREWSVLHPSAKPSVQFNFPPRCLVVGVFEVAEKEGIVTVDEEAKAMLKYMGAYEEGPKTPTVFMIQMAFEILDLLDKA